MNWKRFEREQSCPVLKYWRGRRMVDFLTETGTQHLQNMKQEY
jgi:hypothetical protein